MNMVLNSTLFNVPRITYILPLHVYNARLIFSLTCLKVWNTDVVCNGVPWVPEVWVVSVSISMLCAFQFCFKPLGYLGIYCVIPNIICSPICQSGPEPRVPPPRQWFHLCVWGKHGFEIIDVCSNTVLWLSAGINSAMSSISCLGINESQLRSYH